MTVANNSYEIPWNSEAETAEFGLLLAKQLQAGDVIALVGPLGAGKTRLVQAIALGLDVPSQLVNSPTFVLIQEYLGRIPLRHCDVYRLKTAAEFADLGLDEFFASDGIALIEWADRVVEYLPEDRLEIRLKATGLMSRQATLIGHGMRGEQLVSNLKPQDGSCATQPS